MNQIELRFPLLGENIGGVLFHDMGNVYQQPVEYLVPHGSARLSDFDYMEHAVGFGIRYRTPIGPVRLDLSYSINPPRFIGFSGKFQRPAERRPSIPCQSEPTRCVEQSISHFQFFFSIGQTF